MGIARGGGGISIRRTVLLCRSRLVLQCVRKGFLVRPDIIGEVLEDMLVGDKLIA